MIVTDILFKLYRTRNHRLRRRILTFVTALEGGELYSKTLRKIFKDYYDIKIGLYTMGGCFTPYQIDRHTTIGRYCSFARTLRIINRNHPLEFKSTHALFCVTSYHLCEEDLVHHIPLKIGNDVWVAHNAIVMPNVTEIADGVVIAAGAVVNKNPPPYAVVVGNPARVVRYRFSKEVIEELLLSRWWEKSLEELKPSLSSFQRPYEKEILNKINS
jgi:acetyltransferase-like isoleucine patch superfamily enzyme